MASLEPRVLLSSPDAAMPPALAERLARGVAYDNWTMGQAVISDGIALGYTVDRIFNDPATGFYAIGMKSQDYGPALVCRGTEPTTLADLLSDLNPKGIGYDQFAATWTDVSAWLSEQPEADIVGHSLGGALVQWISAAFMKITPGEAPAIDQVFTFCAPGITDNRIRTPNLITYASDFFLARATSVTHYIVPGDIVVMAGERYISGTVVTASFRDLNLLNKHTLPVLNATIGTSSAPPGIVFGTMTSNQLSAPSYVHNDPDYRMIVMALQITANGLAAAAGEFQPLTLVPPLLMRRDTAEASRKVIGKLLGLAGPNFSLSVTTQNRTVLTLSSQTHPIFRSTSFIFDRDINVTLLAGLPPTLRFDGAMSLNLATSFTLPVPSWLGGPFNVNSFLNLGDLDFNGQIDANRMTVGGNMSVLGGVATATGSTTFNWSQKRLIVHADTINFLEGFVTAQGTMNITAGPNLWMSGNSSVNIPNAPFVPRWLRGQSLAQGFFNFNYTHDGTFGNDYIAGWGTLGPVTAGMRVYLDGSVQFIGGVRFPSIFRPGDSGSSFGGEGASFEVPAGQQWLLLHAGWEIPSATAAVRLISPSGQIFEEADIATSPSMQFVPELYNSTNRGVYITAPQPGIWRIEMVDSSPGLGQIEFSAFGDVPQLDGEIVSVSGGQRRQPVQVQMQVIDPRNTARVALFYDTDNTGADGVLIADGLTPAGGVVDFTWDVADIPTGSKFIYAVIDDPEHLPIVRYAPAAVNITEPQPIVVGSVLEFREFQELHFEFDQDVSSSLDLEDLMLTNVTTNTTIPAALLSLEYDIYTNTATLRWPGATAFGTTGILEDGDYRLTAPASGITNSDLEPLADDLEIDFFILAADANRDRQVNLLDFNILAASFGASPRDFTQGDFNYDGVVNLTDFNILAERFGKTLDGDQISTGRGIAIPTVIRADKLLTAPRASESISSLTFNTENGDFDATDPD